MAVAKVWLLWMAVSLWMVDPMERMEFGLRSGGQVPQRGVGWGVSKVLPRGAGSRWMRDVMVCRRKTARKTGMKIQPMSVNIHPTRSKRSLLSANNHHCFHHGKNFRRLHHGNIHRPRGNLRHHPGLGHGHQEWQELRVPPAR